MASMEAVAGRLPAFAWDVLAVVGLAVVGVVTARDVPDSKLGLGLLILLPLLVRRRWPEAVLIAVSALAATTSTRTATPFVQVGAVALASFTAGELAGDRVRSALLAVLNAALISFGLLLFEADMLPALVVPFGIVVPSWLAGDWLRTRRVADAERAAAEARAAYESELRLRAAVAAERRQMARELHDVVAHGVSVMLIQAGAARQVVETSPERASEALLTVEATGREAMAELRRLLGVLNDEGEAAALAPQPGLDQLAALIERVRDAGLPTELEVTGTPVALPASVDVTVYRIVQEALTNALRYARRAATLVHLSYEPDQLRVEVLDEGPAAPSDGSDGGGRGLAGMQERAALVGGRIEAGPRLGGGFAVRAWLPIAPGPG
jgi:signal transduction histidine kinase